MSDDVPVDAGHVVLDGMVATFGSIDPSGACAPSPSARVDRRVRDRVDCWQQPRLAVPPQLAPDRDRAEPLHHRPAPRPGPGRCPGAPSSRRRARRHALPSARPCRRPCPRSRGGRVDRTRCHRTRCHRTRCRPTRCRRTRCRRTRYWSAGAPSTPRCGSSRPRRRHRPPLLNSVSRIRPPRRGRPGQDGLRGVDLDRLRSSNWARATASKAVTIPARSTSSRWGAAAFVSLGPGPSARSSGASPSASSRGATGQRPCPRARRRAARRALGAPPGRCGRRGSPRWPAARHRHALRVAEGGDRLHLRGAVLDVHDDEEACRREPARYAQ